MLWLWRRPAAVALIHLLAWKLPYAASAALKKREREKKKKGKDLGAFVTSPCLVFLFASVMINSETFQKKTRRSVKDVREAQRGR